jgi:small subunit ribosomal protein S20
MAITKSAKKAIRQSERKFVMNLRRRRAIHDTVKDARKAVGQDRKAQDASLSVAYQAIDKALKRGIIKKNTAARKKSRLVKLLKKGTVKTR